MQKIIKNVDRVTTELQEIVNWIYDRANLELQEDSESNENIDEIEDVLKQEEAMRLVVSSLRLNSNTKSDRDEKIDRSLLNTLQGVEGRLKETSSIRDELDLIIDVVLLGTAVYEGDSKVILKAIKDVEESLK